MRLLFFDARPGMFFGIPIVSIWYWCVDQEMAQRVISAKNLNEAQLGSVVAGLMKALPAFITGEYRLINDSWFSGI